MQIILSNYTIGRGGLISPEEKKEGDGATPLGAYSLREVWYRPDRIPKPTTALPIRKITPEDCWCDDAGHVLYNQHFTAQHYPPVYGGAGGEALENNNASPLNPPVNGGNIDNIPTSYEHLWREDHAYDLIVVIGYNDDPPIPGKGSAIFMHLKHDDGRPTAGCVALDKNDLLALLAQLKTDAKICISEKEISII